MKIIGVSAGVVGHDSNIDRMVKAIMEKSSDDHEFIKLNDLDYSACKGCSWLCAKPQICTLEDDLQPYVQKVRDADAVVLGSPIHFRTVSPTMLSFISRLWGFRHVDYVLKDKPFALALSGINADRGTPEEDFRRALSVFKVDVLDVIKYSSRIPPCYRCGRHQECEIGGAYSLWGDKARSLVIRPELFNRWEDNEETVNRVDAIVEKLKQSENTR
ncbi:flavodoxin family protein [Candidatus Bathyarchaeota archaeon]|nr:flavodoxin family protein [Candidatus Bathyarchaeota archaeon]MBL7168165.1 flavodoxin family protein [Candidatus Bathyarchaeota archaeon]